MDPNETLMELIRARGTKSEPWDGGILPADRYVKTIQTCVGSDLCYRYAAKGNVSFDDVVKRAANTLTYNNRDMIVEEQFDVKTVTLPSGIELPKNTLMVFKHVLTTDSKDRDGDTLRTKGAKPDPQMLLLWQHIHTLPIGKMLAVADHTDHKLTMYSAVVDINELAHDAAVMIDNKMGRFSHGFKALEYMEVKDEKGKTGNGFDITSFEIMEESLVSVPANADAQTEEVLLSMVEGGKLTSPVMKSYGGYVREKRHVSVPVKIDLNLLVNGQPIGEGHHVEVGSKSGTKCAGKPGCSCGCGGPAGGSGTPKKTDDDTDNKKPADGKEVITDGEKAGRVLSAKNLSALKQAHEHLGSAKEDPLITHGTRSKVHAAHQLVGEVLSGAMTDDQMDSGDGPVMGSVGFDSMDLKDAFAVILARAEYGQRVKYIEILAGLNSREDQDNRTLEYLAFAGQEE